MKPQASPQKKGFTLLEILLTVAISAAATASAAAVYQWSRLRADIALSSRNLRQLVTANLNYAQDHNGHFCPAQDQSNLRRWHGGRKRFDAPFSPDGGFLTPYFGRDVQLETCPLLRRIVDASVSFEEGAGGYGYNSAYIGGSPGDCFSPASLLDVEFPGRTVMFATTALARAEGMQEYPFAEPFFWPLEDGSDGGELQPSVHFRAHGCAIVAWCDGRVSLEKPSTFKPINFYGGDNEKSLIGWFGPEKENGFWNPKSPAARFGAGDQPPSSTPQSSGSSSHRDKPSGPVTLEPPQHQD